MIRTLKAIFLVAAAAFAISGPAAPAAQAVPFFSSELEETAISSKPDGTKATAHQVFDFAGLTTTCTGVDFSGTQKSSTTTELLLEGTFTGCSFLGLNTAIKMNGCAFLAHASGKADIVNKTKESCVSEPMTITWAFPGSECVVEIAPQAGLVGFDYGSLEGEVTMAAHLAEIKYTAAGLGCSNVGTLEGGRYTTGNTILTGSEVGGEGKMTNISFTRPGGQFHTELSETTVTSTADGTGEATHHVFDVAEASLTCSSVSFTGTTGTTISKIGLKLAYSGCTFLGEPTTVEASGCTLFIRASGNISISVSCTAEPITWEVTGCKIEIGEQASLNEFIYSNISPGTTEEITMEADVAGIKYTSSGKSCPKAGTFEDGRYTTGNTILTGSEVGGEGKMTNFWVE